MYKGFARSATAAGALALLTVAALTGCSNDNSSSASATSTPAATSASAAAAPADPAVTKAVTDAYVTFFDAKSPADRKQASIEKGDAFAQVLAAQAANPQSQGTSVTVSAVHAVDATHADVTYTLLLNGTPALPDQSGKSVQENGQWKVAAATFCALLTMQGTTAPAC